MFKTTGEKPAFNLGERLRAVRRLHRLTQRELARRTGVNNASISLIEHNRMSPSVGLLKRVLDGIPMSLEAFFNEDSAPTEQIFFRHEELTEIDRGLIKFRQVGANLKNRALQMMYDCYKPGGDTDGQMLSHQGEEAGIVIQGTLEVTVADRKCVLRPGDAYYFDSRLPHRFRNPGEEDCIIVTATTPPTF
jgi:transcriptional regulator with XRE-family HTH domain